MQPANVPYHNFQLGNMRRKHINDGSIELSKVESGKMPMIINFNDQLKWIREHKSRLRVSSPIGRYYDVSFIRKDKTIEFAEKHIKKHGCENAEKILSSTETGCLYFNIIYHFQTFDNLESQIKVSLRS